MVRKRNKKQQPTPPPPPAVVKPKDGPVPMDIAMTAARRDLSDVFDSEVSPSYSMYSLFLYFIGHSIKTIKPKCYT